MFWEAPIKSVDFVDLLQGLKPGSLIGVIAGMNPGLAPEWFFHSLLVDFDVAGAGVNSDCGPPPLAAVMWCLSKEPCTVIS